jgi:ATP-dependent Clp protease adaptor protein ClpS
MSPKRAIVHIPLVEALSDTQLENVCEVILHNDDHNAMEHVVTSLMRVFRHSQALAVKIMFEAHVRGSAIAEVEGEGAATRHRDQLQSLGLIATVEKV